MLNDVISTIDRMKNQLIETTLEFLEVKVVSPDADYSIISQKLKQAYESAGLHAKLVTAPKEKLDSMGLSYPRPNVLGFFEGSRRKGTLQIFAHMDTVSPNDVSKWNLDPFKPALTNARIYGLGAIDSRSSLVSALFAARVVIDSGKKLENNLLLMGTVDDEVGGAERDWPGTPFMVEYGHDLSGWGLPDYAINAESSGLENIWGAFRGRYTFELEIRGLKAHAGTSHGINAVEKALKFVEEVKSMQIENDEILGSDAIFLFRVSGGDHTPDIPDKCEVGFDIRTVTTTEKKRVPNYIKKVINELSESDPDFLPGNLSVRRLWEPIKIDPVNPLVMAIRQSAERLGFKASYSGLLGAGQCYPYLMKGIPCVTYGPGTMDRPHAPNEFITVDELLTQTKMYALTILQMCG